MDIKNVIGVAVLGGALAGGIALAHNAREKREEKRNAPVGAADLAAQLLDRYDRDGVGGAKDGAIALSNPTGVPQDAETFRRVPYVGYGVAHRAEYSVAGLAGAADQQGDGNGRADRKELTDAIATFDAGGASGLEGTEREALDRHFANGSALNGPGSVTGERLIRWGTATGMGG